MSQYLFLIMFLTCSTLQSSLLCNKGGIVNVVSYYNLISILFNVCCNSGIRGELPCPVSVIAYLKTVITQSAFIYLAINAMAAGSPRPVLGMRLLPVLEFSSVFLLTFTFPMPRAEVPI